RAFLRNLHGSSRFLRVFERMEGAFVGSPKLAKRLGDVGRSRSPAVPARVTFALQFEPLLAARSERLRARHQALQEVEEREVPPQRPPVTVIDHRVERAVRIEELTRVLPYPEPAPHLEGERQVE